MVSVANCESGFRPDAFNARDPHGGSKGIFQFQLSTFNKYAPGAGVASPSWGDPDQSIRIATYMFSIGEAKQWSCWWLVHNLEVPWLKK